MMRKQETDKSIKQQLICITWVTRPMKYFIGKTDATFLLHCYAYTHSDNINWKSIHLVCLWQSSCCFHLQSVYIHPTVPVTVYYLSWWCCNNIEVPDSMNEFIKLWIVIERKKKKTVIRCCADSSNLANQNFSTNSRDRPHGRAPWMVSQVGMHQQ